MKDAVLTAEPRRLLFVFAHPDDEALGAGATIAHYVRRGDEVTIVTCTRGERGDVIPERLAHLADDQAALAAHRDLELRDALMALGVTRHAYLGTVEARQAGKPVRMYRDTGMTTAADGSPRLPQQIDPESLCAADLAEVAGDIAAVIEQISPDVIVTENSYGGYGHPDHIRVHDAVMAALRMCAEEAVPRGVFVLEHPARVTARAAAEVRDAGVFTPLPAVPRAVIADKFIDVVIADEDVRPAKEAALRAHVTQLDLRATQIGHSDGRGELLTATEYFREVGGAITRPSPRPTTDFFDGWDDVDLREDGALINGRSGAVLGRPVKARTDILTVVAFIIVGIVLGATAAAGHRATFSVGSTAVPVGFVLTLAAIILGHVAVRITTLSRLPAAGLAAGTIVAIAILNLTGPGGSVLFPAQNLVAVDGTLTAVDNVASIVWITVAALSASLIAAWPRLGSTAMVAKR